LKDDRCFIKNFAKPNLKMARRQLSAYWGILMAFYCSERSLYGSSRLGVFKSSTALSNAIPTWLSINYQFNPTPIAVNRTTGNKHFELSNHLGNVLAVVSDYKKPIIAPTGYADHFQAVVLSTQDYYPFGSVMVGRGFVGDTVDNYRFGFNTQEGMMRYMGLIMGQGFMIRDLADGCA